jgi:hypothetical protein
MALSDFDLVLFGGSGDLAMRKLLPAMFSRDVCGDLPPTARIVCVGRQESTQEEFINMVTTTSRPHIKSAKATDENWNRFIARIVYVALDATDSATYKGLAEALRTDPAITRVYYLATPPALFSRICDNLKENGLATANSRVVLEKPLGRDLASAKQINKEVGKVFEEQQIYRIDHYLGKETVQNLLALRFGNILFEPLWRREWISDVQITIAEKLGVGNRIGYYDTSGALRDMLQNHLLQLLCIVAMEPPTSIAPDAVRDSKLQVLRSLKRFTPTTLAQNIVRGQYRAGHVEGKAVPSYRDEPEAPQNSKTETFVAMKVEIDTWRWAGAVHGRFAGRNRGALQADPALDLQPADFQLPAEFPGNPPAARRRPAHEPDGQDPGRRHAPETGRTGTGLPRNLQDAAHGCLRAPAAGRAARPTDPVHARRRAGSGMGMGRTYPEQLGAGRFRAAAIRLRHLGSGSSQCPDRPRRATMARRSTP